MKKQILTLILTTALSSSSLAAMQAGGIDSGGGSIPNATDGAAWFLEESENPKTIDACLDLASNFGMSKKEVEATIDWAFKEWSDYVVKKNVNSNAVRPAQTPKDFRPATKLNLSSCTSNTDLRFVIGKDPNAQFKVSRNQLGLAHRDSYDLNSLWGKGYVWVSEEKDLSKEQVLIWSKKKLQIILLHELGHVFGVPHFSNTAMSETLIDRLVFKDDSDTNSYFQKLEIELGVELALPYYGMNQERPISLGQSPKESVVNFETLAGRKPVGKISALVRELDQTYGNVLELVLNDEVKSTTLTVNLNSYILGDRPIETFKMAFPYPPQPGEAIAIAGGVSFSYVAGGTITLPSGDVKPFVFSRNMEPWSTNGQYGYVKGTRYILSVFQLRWIDDKGNMTVFAGSGWEY